MSYCALEDFQTNSLGSDLSGIGVDELQSILDAASVLVDQYSQTTWAYQSIQHEQHDWPEDWNQRWEAYPYYSPIRFISLVEVGVTLAPNTGDYAPFLIPTTPVGTTTNPPQVFGQVFIDRSRGFVQTVYTMLRYVLEAAYPALQMSPMQMLIDYTAGYDDGTVQADGLSFPYPAWLIEATRWTAQAMVGDRALAQLGLTGLGEARFGSITLRRGSRGTLAQSEVDIPPMAKAYLKPHIRASMR